MFDVYDRAEDRFWSTPRRNGLADALGLQLVPHVATGHFDLAGLRGLLGESKIGDGPAEGVYVRRDEGEWLATRAKLVRPEFVQSIEEHWSRRALRSNSLLRS